MPASKRRAAAARAAAAARGAPSGDADITAERPDIAAEATAAGGAATANSAVDMGTAATDATPAKPARTPRQRHVETDPAYMPWPRAALMALLAAVFVLQMLIGLGQHFIFHRDRLIWIDLFFPNAILLLAGTMIVAPLVKRVLKLPRHLRWLESLSLGAVYALIVTLLTLTLIHTPQYPASIKNPTADDLMNALNNSDVPGLVIASTFGILFAAQVFPGLSRLITAPGRRAKKRLEERTGNRAGRPGAAKATAAAKKPARPPRTSASKTAPKIRRS